MSKQYPKQYLILFGSVATTTYCNFQFIIPLYIVVLGDLNSRLGGVYYIHLTTEAFLLFAHFEARNVGLCVRVSFQRSIILLYFGEDVKFFGAVLKIAVNKIYPAREIFGRGVNCTMFIAYAER